MVLLAERSEARSPGIFVNFLVLLQLNLDLHFRTFQDFSGLSGLFFPFQDFSGLFRTFRTFFSISGLFRTLQDRGHPD
jgi:hypothetical protein